MGGWPPACLSPVCVPLMVHTPQVNKEFDLLAFDLHSSRDNSIRFVCAYLPPDSTKDITVVKKLIYHFDSLMIYSRTYIVGDFNFDKIIWKNGRSLQSSKSMEFSCFYDFLLKNNLVQLVTDVTQVSGSTLDLFIAPHNNTVTKISVEEPFTDTCDHFMIIACLTLQELNSKDRRQRKNFYAADYCQINDFLRNIDWLSLLDQNNIEQNYEQFIGILQKSIELYVPTVSSYNKPRTPKHLKSLFLQKKKLYKLSKTTSTAKEEYKRID